MKLLRISFAVLALTFASQQSYGEQIFMDFQGNAGFGLLPGNENPAVGSAALGGEFGTGLVYDDVLNTLSLLFNFDAMTGGLDTDVANGGIHLHLSGDMADPFGSNGGVVFFINSGTDAMVTNNTPLIVDGAISGSVNADVVFSEAQEADLLAGRYYLNLHSAEFGSGELRGNLVRAIPEPATGSVLGLGLLGLIARRKRSQA